MSNIDSIISEYTDAGKLHGVNFAVVGKDGNAIYNGAHGSLELKGNKNKPMALDTVCFLASQTKLMTSISVMQLVEKGLVGLDDDVGKLVPFLADLQILQPSGGPTVAEMKALQPSQAGEEAKEEAVAEPVLVKAKNPVTLRLLLSHSSGFAYDISSPDLQAWSKHINRTANTWSGSMEGYRHPLIFEPGTDWSYGCGIDWAGQVVEAISKKTLGQYMQENIWDVLGMVDTTFHPENRDGAYESRKMEIGLRAEPVGPLLPFTNPFPVPATDDCGGIGTYSTSADYIKLLRSLITNDGKLLKAESLDQLFGQQLKDNSHLMRMLAGPGKDVLAGTWPEGMPANHALCGTMNLEDVPKGPSAGTVNWGGAANTFWWVDRKKGIAATFMTQVLPPGDKTALELLKKLQGQVYKSHD